MRVNKFSILLCAVVIASVHAMADELTLPPTAADVARSAVFPVAGTQSPTGDSKKSETARETPESDTRKNPETPALFQSLVDRGNVEFEFYDPRKNPRTFDGETHFRFSLTYQYRYTYRIRDKDDVRTAFVKTRFSNISILCKNKIYIPKRFVGDGFWKAKLVQHEFEHVRVNCDDRPRLIANHLLQRIGDFEIPLKDGQDLKRADLEVVINERVAAIRKALTELIQSNNDYLDELTKHGIRNLETPGSFFQTLYEPERLEKLKFPFLDDVKTLVKSEKYLSGHD